MPFEFKYVPTKRELKEGYARTSMYFGHGEMTSDAVTRQYVQFLRGCGYSISEEREESIGHNVDSRVNGRFPTPETHIDETIRGMATLQNISGHTATLYDELIRYSSSDLRLSAVSESAPMPDVDYTYRTRTATYPQYFSTRAPRPTVNTEEPL